MQVNNRLIYDRGGKPIKKAQSGALVQGLGLQNAPSMGNFDPSQALQQGMSNIKKVNIPSSPIGGGGGGLLSAAAGVASDMVGKLFGPRGGGDPIQGGIDKGLSSDEMNEIENTAKGSGIASNILGTVGDLAGNIPGPWGAIAKFGLNTIGKGFAGKQANEQTQAVSQLVAANTERTNNNAQMQTRASMGQKGGLLYKGSSNHILSLVSGGIYKDGGKAPELKWDHPFKIDLPESILEKKKSPVKVFKRGGKFDNPDKTNVIVTGARHHENNSLGDKGVPVVDKTGEKVFEVEKGELILTKNVTEKIEEFLAKYKKVEVDEDKAHEVLKKLGTFFKDEIKENLHNYEENAV